MALAVLAGHTVHAHNQAVGVVAFVGVSSLDFFGRGLMLAATAAAVAQMMYKTVNAVADHGQKQ